MHSAVDIDELQRGRVNVVIQALGAEALFVSIPTAAEAGLPPRGVKIWKHAFGGAELVERVSQVIDEHLRFAAAYEDYIGLATSEADVRRLVGEGKIAMVMMLVSTLLLDAGQIDGLAWMILVGLGAYLAYVPFGSVLFDRRIAATGFVGTAVFAIYLTDAIFILSHLFMGGAGPACLAAAESTGNRSLDLADSVFLLNFLCNGGDAPPAPFPQCGPYEADEDDLPCESAGSCAA